MARYRVGFYNDLPDPTGHDHRACQREIEVATDAGRDQAIADAIRSFELLEKVPEWSLRARIIECACLEAGA